MAQNPKAALQQLLNNAVNTNLNIFLFNLIRRNLSKLQRK